MFTIFFRSLFEEQRIRSERPKWLPVKMETARTFEKLFISFYCSLHKKINIIYSDITQDLFYMKVCYIFHRNLLEKCRGMELFLFDYASYS